MLSELSHPEDERRAAALPGLREAFARLAFDAQGCRVAQAALDVAGRGEQAELALELRGRILEAIDSPFANYVVQKVVERLPPKMVTFVVEELAGVVVQTAKHRYGIRILCRLLEHCPQEQIGGLIAEALEEAPALCRHSYGNYLIKHIMEHGSAEQRKAVVGTLLRDPLGFASHRTGSTVVERALSHRELAEALTRDATSLAKLACCRYGHFVAKALLQLPGKASTEACALLARVSPRLQASKFGKRVLAELATVSAEA